MNLGRETETVEFKESLAEKDEAMKAMGAILNKRGEGTIYFGVLNNGDVTGLVVGPKTESDVAQKINSSVEPVPFYRIQTKNTPEGKEFIEVSFRGLEKPYRAKGNYYLRNGERDDLMPTSLLSEMFLQSKKTYDEWESAVSDCGIDDVDENLVRETMETGNRLNRLRHPYQNTEDSLMFLHLVTKDKRINNAGKALYSKNRPITVRLATLGDLEGKTYLDMQRVSGNIFELIDQSYDYLLSKLDYKPFYKNGKIQRDMEIEIPPLAIRELVINAFGHAYYAAPLAQEIAVYPNRISIYNPGPFPTEATPEDFASKLAKPIDKNDRINNALYFHNYIEHFGTGFTKAFDLFAEKKISYRYYNFNGGFLFEVFRPGKVMVNETDSDHKKLLDLLTQNRYASLEEMTRVIGKSKSTVSRLIAALKEEDRIQRIGSDKAGYWVVK